MFEDDPDYRGAMRNIESNGFIKCDLVYFNSAFITMFFFKTHVEGINTTTRKQEDIRTIDYLKSYSDGYVAELKNFISVFETSKLKSLD